MQNFALNFSKIHFASIQIFRIGPQKQKIVIYHTPIIRWHQVDILLYGQDQPFIVVKGKKMMQNAEEILDHNFLYKIFAKLYL